MPYTTVVPGTTITAAWANANVRDQVVTPFANAAARSSAITAPVDGMLSTLTDVKGLDYYDGAAAAWRQPNILFVRRTADATSIINTTTLADDTQLFVTVPASSIYEVRSMIFYYSSTAADLKIGWSGPSGASFDWNFGGMNVVTTDANGGMYSGVNTISGTDTAGGAGAPTPVVVARPSGLLVTGANSGTFKFRWAQGTADAVNGTLVKANSYLLLTRVG